MFPCIFLRMVFNDSISYLLFLLKNNNNSNNPCGLAKGVCPFHTRINLYRNGDRKGAELLLLSEINNALSCVQVGSLVREHLEK